MSTVPPQPLPTDPPAEDPVLLLQQVAAALRLARWQGIEAVPRAKVADPPAQQQRPQPAQQQRPQPAQPQREQVPQPQPQRPSQPLPTARALPSLAAELTQARQLARTKLDEALGRAGTCTKCPRATGRLRVVAPGGNPQARLLVVIDAPSSEDERANQPAQGAAGALLDRMLGAMGLHRDDVWLSYMCLCRGSSDQAVTPDQALACSPWLRQQFEVVTPQAMVLFGQGSAQYLLRSTAPLAELRGRWGQLRGVPILATWGLDEVLVDPAKKREVWTDLQQVMAQLGLRR